MMNPGQIAIVGMWVGFVLIYISVIAGIVYVAVHFITKFW